MFSITLLVYTSKGIKIPLISGEQLSSYLSEMLLCSALFYCVVVLEGSA